MVAGVIKWSKKSVRWTLGLVSWPQVHKEPTYFLRKQSTPQNITCAVDNAAADRAPPSGFQTYRTLKFAVSSVAPVSVLKTEGSIPYLQ